MKTLLMPVLEMVLIFASGIVRDGELATHLSLFDNAKFC